MPVLQTDCQGCCLLLAEGAATDIVLHARGASSAGSSGRGPATTLAAPPRSPPRRYPSAHLSPCQVSCGHCLPMWPDAHTHATKLGCRGAPTLLGNHGEAPEAGRAMLTDALACRACFSAPFGGCRTARCTGKVLRSSPCGTSCFYTCMNGDLGGSLIYWSDRQWLPPLRKSIFPQAPAERVAAVCCRRASPSKAPCHEARGDGPHKPRPHRCRRCRTSSGRAPRARPRPQPSAALGTAGTSHRSRTPPIRFRARSCHAAPAC